jgi:hypothetical protein
MAQTASGTGRDIVVEEESSDRFGFDGTRGLYTEKGGKKYVHVNRTVRTVRSRSVAKTFLSSLCNLPQSLLLRSRYESWI